MKRSAFCLALLGWPLSGAEKPVSLAPVALYVRFEQPLPVGETEALERELRLILAPVGFNFEWRSADDTTNEVWADLAVVTFKGHCAAEDLTRGKRFYAGALGWTHVSDGKVLPFAVIDCDRIGAFLGPELLGGQSNARERIFGRAIARVAAHELYHVFTQSSVHAAEGVAKAEFTVSELLSDGFRFHSGEASVLRKKGAQALLQFSLRQSQVGRGPAPAAGADFVSSAR